MSCVISGKSPSLSVPYGSPLSNGDDDSTSFLGLCEAERTCDSAGVEEVLRMCWVPFVWT